MNYLMHLFFSDPGEEALLGSLMGDFVKGNPTGRFRAAVSDAIRFHRKIDSFSDAHPIPRQSRNRISPSRRRFAGIIVDVCYDHFLGFFAELAAFCAECRNRCPDGANETAAGW